MKAIILAHGGAGVIPDSRVQPKLEGLKKAIKEGVSSFLKEKNARHAVCATLACMEDNPAFNAGRSLSKTDFCTITFSQNFP